MAYDEELAARVRDHLSGEPGLTERRMFGGLAFLVDGHMAVVVGSHGQLMARVPPERTEELLREPHTEPTVMNGRALRGWVDVQPAQADVRRWADLGVSYARSLPPK